MEKYNNALVFGKFMPFHKGHMALINHALSIAKRVTIVVLAEKHEPIDGFQRFCWVRNIYQNPPRSKVLIFDYDATKDGLVTSSVPNKDVSKKWMHAILSFLEKSDTPDVLAASEEYIKYCSEATGLPYVMYDEKRQHVSISATQIREHPFDYWDYLAPTVKQDLATHICICGSESSGKTTLTRKIEDSSDLITAIPEIGRCLVGNANTVTQHTLQKVYDITQSIADEVFWNPPTPFIIWDTDQITTASYYSFLFHQPIRKQKDSLTHFADKYFFLRSSVIPFDKDRTRIDEKLAIELSKHHLDAYVYNGISPAICDGPDAAWYEIQNFLNKKHNDIINFFSTKQ